MTTARYAHTVALLRDRRVLFIGGCAETCCSDFHTGAEFYTPFAPNIPRQ